DVPCQVVVQREWPSNGDLERRVGGAVRQSDGRHEVIRQCALERPTFQAALVPASAAHLSAPQDDLFRQPVATRCSRLHAELRADLRVEARATVDRKSTRLNSSHQIISYAGVCLKKK